MSNSSDLSPAEKGYAPRLDHLGNSLSDVRDPQPQGVSVLVTTFIAFYKDASANRPILRADGQPHRGADGKVILGVLVDDRTYDGATMQLADPNAKGA